MRPLAIPAEIANRRDALFVANHSGGKDSQALLIRLAEAVPQRQILVVHASLGDFEWPGALELARDQAQDLGLPFVVARARKTFLDMVEHRFATRPDAPSFPSAAQRQCTSDLKRGPIEREIRRFARTGSWRAVVNCTGIRAEESPRRARLESFKMNARNSIAGRDWFDWAPIHHLSTEEVFATIRDAGQTPHPAYAAGNQRLSCIFCIMASRNDLAHGRQAHPRLFARLVELERRTGYAMHMSRKPLAQLVGTFHGDYAHA